MFRSETVVIVVEFMYWHFKKKILIQQVPFYLAQLVIYFVSLSMNNNDLDWVNIGMCALSTLMLLLKVKNMGLGYFLKFYAWLDITYIGLLLYISIRQI